MIVIDFDPEVVEHRGVVELVLRNLGLLINAAYRERHNMKPWRMSAFDLWTRGIDL